MEAGLGGGEISLRIEDLGKSKLLRFAEKVYELAKQTVPAYSSKYSKKMFTQHQLIAIICLKVRENKTYEGIIDHLIEEPRIRKALDLDEVPHPSTICKAFERLESAVWRAMHLEIPNNIGADIMEVFETSNQTLLPWRKREVNPLGE